MKNFIRPCALAGLLIALITMSSCRMMGINAATDADWFCLAFLPIQWSANDTDQTIIEVKKHNAVWTSLCNNKTVS